MTAEIVAEIAIAVLAFIGTLSGSIMVSQKTDLRLQTLERKMDRYNNLIERVFLLEHDHEKQEKMIEELRHKIEEMREA
jgi:chaperonin cofactor prefoldin